MSEEKLKELAKLVSQLETEIDYLSNEGEVAKVSNLMVKLDQAVKLYDRLEEKLNGSEK